MYMEKNTDGWCITDSKLHVSCFFFRCLEARKNKRVMKVPKGTSDYQATWIVDDDDDENGDMDNESSDDDNDDMLDEAMDGEDEENDSQVQVCFFPFNSIYQNC